MDKNNLEDVTGKQILGNVLGCVRMEYGTIFLDVGLFTYIVLILSIFFFLVERWFWGALTFVLHVPLLLLGIWCGER
ncbi:hypothetical protein SCQ32_03785 [Streptococcus canis]|uniref:hypothetical protein n=1 Tax=Streptococcus canis TaxID=1329 RepID=UPI00299C193E|nr:hypothetical protein [Streptococcus canis]